MELTRESPVLSRREARRNDRRDAILAVAYAYFLDHGYAATSMSAIAAKIGGSKATLWNYFPSKEALFEAVLDQATETFRRDLIALLDPSGDPQQTLREFCVRFTTKVTFPQSVALHRLVHAEAGRFPEIGAIFYERGPRTVQALLGDFIASVMARGVLRRADSRQAAKVLILLCMSGCHQQLLLGAIKAATPELVAADADVALDLFLRTYAPER